MGVGLSAQGVNMNRLPGEHNLKVLFVNQIVFIGEEIISIMMRPHNFPEYEIQKLLFCLLTCEI